MPSHCNTSGQHDTLGKQRVRKPKLSTFIYLIDSFWGKNKFSVPGGGKSDSELLADSFVQSKTAQPEDALVICYETAKFDKTPGNSTRPLPTQLSRHSRSAMDPVISWFCQEAIPRLAAKYGTHPPQPRQTTRPSSLHVAGRKPTPLHPGTLGSEKPTLRTGDKMQGQCRQSHSYCQVYSLLQHLPLVTRTGLHNKVPTLYKMHKIMSVQMCTIIFSRD